MSMPIRRFTQKNTNLVRKKEGLEVLHQDVYEAFLFDDDGDLNTCKDQYNVWEKSFRQDLVLDVNAYATEELLLMVSVVIVLARIQEVTEANIAHLLNVICFCKVHWKDRIRVATSGPGLCIF